MSRAEKVDLKQELLQQAADLQTPAEETVKLKRNMSIPDMVKALAPELKKALPSAITPERFTRIALSALNNTTNQAAEEKEAVLGAGCNLIKAVAH